MSSDPNVMRQMSLQHKLAYIDAVLTEALNATGLPAAVILVMMNENEYSAIRIPDCSEKCDNPEKCSVDIFMLASEHLHDIAHEIEDGTAKVLLKAGRSDA